MASKRYSMTIRRRTYHGDTLAEMSAIYSGLRDASHEGGSTWPDAKVMEGGIQIGRISYNGRVWPPGNWSPDMVPLYDNRSTKL